jgi:hypothetical protein
MHKDHGTSRATPHELTATLLVAMGVDSATKGNNDQQNFRSHWQTILIAK